MSHLADRLYWIHALSPLHVGTGRGEGHIDLPIARERATDLPYVPGSSVRGVLSDHHGATDERRKASAQGATEEERLLHLAFGSVNEQTGGSAGALGFTDARLVCLPARSVYGTFAWCSCPLILARLKRDMDMAGEKSSPAVPAPPPGARTYGLTAPNNKISNGKRIYLEDLDFHEESSDKDVAAWAERVANSVFDRNDPWVTVFKEHFVVISDDLFGFLAATATEVRAHIRIDPERKTVATGAFWYEESLPAETILAGVAWVEERERCRGPIKTKLLTNYCVNHDLLQMGGNASTGQGRVRLRFTEPGKGAAQ